MELNYRIQTRNQIQLAIGYSFSLLKLSELQLESKSSRCNTNNIFFKLTLITFSPTTGCGLNALLSSGRGKADTDRQCWILFPFCVLHGAVQTRPNPSRVAKPRTNRAARRRPSRSRAATGPRSPAPSCRPWKKCLNAPTTPTRSCARTSPKESASARPESRYTLTLDALTCG